MEQDRIAVGRGSPGIGLARQQRLDQFVGCIRYVFNIITGILQALERG